jgi:TatD DNase family protein
LLCCGGECGLDKRIEIPPAAQQVVLRSNYFGTTEYNKPVKISCVAVSEVIDTKKKLNIQFP